MLTCLHYKNQLSNIKQKKKQKKTKKKNKNRLKLEIGCKQGFQYTPRKIIILHVYKQWSRNGYVKNAVNLSEINFSVP